MRPCRSFAVSFLVAALCADPATAQQITVSSDVARPGDKIEITYSNVNMAGKTVQIEVSNLDPMEPITRVFVVTLDAAGEGKVVWVAEPWAWAEVSAPDARDKTIFIR